MAGLLGLQETLNQIRSIAYGIWRKRWYMVMSAWVVCLLGWSLTMSTPYRYTSAGTLFMNTKALFELMNIPVSNSKNKDLQQLKRILLDDKTINQIIDRSELTSIIKTDAQKRAAVAEMRDSIVIRPSQENYFIIEYEASESDLPEEGRRKLAKLVVEQLMQTAKNITPAISGHETNEQKRFAETQLKKAKNDYATAEQNHSEYQRDYFQVLNKSNAASDLDRVQSELKLALNEKALLDAKMKLENDRLSQTPRYEYKPRSTLNGGGQNQLDILEGRLKEMQKKLDGLISTGVKEKHPYYKLTMRSIDSIKKQIKDEKDKLDKMIEEVKKTNQSTSEILVLPNGAYETIRDKLNSYEEEMILVEQTITEKRQDIKDLNNIIETGPTVRNKFKDIEDNLKRKRREVKNWEERLKKITDEEDVRRNTSAVVSEVRPATTPSAPSGPPRLLYLSFSLVGGIIVGVGVAVILSSVKPVIMSVEQLRDHFDLPVLGNVTVMMDEEAKAKSRRDMLLFGAAGGGMFALFFLLIILDSMTV